MLLSYHRLYAATMFNIAVVMRLSVERIENGLYYQLRINHLNFFCVVLNF